MRQFRILVVTSFSLVLLATLFGCAGTTAAMEHYDRGIDYFDEGHFDEAIAEFTEAIELDPELALAYANRGFAYATKGELDSAIADLDKVIEVSTNPDLIQAAREAIIVLEG